MAVVKFSFTYNYFLAATIMLLPSIALSQQYIHGVVQDKNAQPIAYAHIRVVDQNIIRVCNSNGEFNLPPNQLPCKIIVIATGYNTDTFMINSLQNNLILKQTSYMLPEAVISEINPYKIYEKCVSQLNTTIGAKYCNAFMRLYSQLGSNSTYEFIETQLISRVSNYSVISSEFTNGRYGYIDSLANYGATRSIDLSNLLKPFQVAAYNPLHNQLLPIFPFIKKDYKKAISIKSLGYIEVDDALCHHLIITPKNKYKQGIFSAQMFVNHRTGQIKYANLSIVNPNKTILRSNKPNHIVVIDTLNLEIKFDNQSIHENYPQVIVMKINYHLSKIVLLRSGLHISQVEIPGNTVFNPNEINNTVGTSNFSNITTTLQYVSLDDNREGCIDSAYDNYDDRIWINHLLFVPEMWSQNEFLVATKSESDVIKKFSEHDIFINKFENKHDTVEYLNSNQFEFLKRGSLYYTTYKKPEKQLGNMVLRITFDTINYDTVGEYYFDIKVFHSYANGKLHFVVFPVFDYQYSWRDTTIIDDDFNERLFTALSNHTLKYKQMISEQLSAINTRCVNGRPARIVIDELLADYRKSRDELLSSTYKNIISQRIYLRLKD